LAAHFDVDGVGVAADIAIGLENGNVVVPPEPVGCHQAGDPGTDNGDTVSSH
jgi:hypothetical protein